MGREQKEHFRVTEGALVADADLRREHLDEFCRAARRLKSEPGPELLLDLSRVRFIFSSYLGAISNLAQDCHNLGKRLLVKVPERLAWVFRIDRNMDLFLRIVTVKEEEQK